MYHREGKTGKPGKENQGESDAKKVTQGSVTRKCKKAPKGELVAR
jgi:hypothetical protein